MTFTTEWPAACFIEVTLPLTETTTEVKTLGFFFLDKKTSLRALCSAKSNLSWLKPIIPSATTPKTRLSIIQQQKLTKIPVCLQHVTTKWDSSLRSRHFMSPKTFTLSREHLFMIRIYDCCCPCTFNVSNINFTIKNPNETAPIMMRHGKYITPQEIYRHFTPCCILLWFGNGWFYPYPSGLFHWHWGNHMIAPVPAKQPWRIWVNKSH